MARLQALRYWWLRCKDGYRAPMSESPRTRRVAALPRPSELNEFEGMWVAVDGHEIIAVGETSHQLALKLHAMDYCKRRRVVIEFVRPTTDSYIVGAG